MWHRGEVVVGERKTMKHKSGQTQNQVQRWHRFTEGVQEVYLVVGGENISAVGTHIILISTSL